MPRESSGDVSPVELAAAWKAAARAEGFALAGICPAIELTQPHALLRRWLDHGFAGEMRYIENRFAAYADPRFVLEGCRSLMMLGMRYRTDEPGECQPGQGNIARYAWGSADYHDVIHDRLSNLADWLLARAPQARVRGVVDSAPLLEREFAQMAGLGWIGKNTLLLNRAEGSYFFLAALLTDLDLPADAPVETDHCGTCTACLDACPTNAFPEPYVLDARRCISYLTIEHRGTIDPAWRRDMGGHVFGCDICQEVCPWNRKAPTSDEPDFAPVPGRNPVDLLSLFRLTDDEFKTLFRKTPLWRSKRRGLLRNAAIALGNQQFAELDRPHVVDALTLGLRDAEPLVRGASAWALGQTGGAEAITILREARARELDSTALAEIDLALEELRA